MKVRWSSAARDDLVAIKSAISRDSIAYADVVIDRIVLRADGVAKFPVAGHVVPEYGKEDVREVFVHSYRLIYKIDREVIHMLAVIHGARLLPSEPPRLDES